MYIYIYIYIYINTYVCMYVCMYIYIYILNKKLNILNVFAGNICFHKQVKNQ